MERKIEEGLWLGYQVLIYGCKASNEIAQKILDERKLNPDENYHEGQGPTLFNLHEEWTSLDGWWIGNEDNPEGLVIGSELWSNGERPNVEILDLEELEKSLEDTKQDFMMFGQLGTIAEIIEEDNPIPKLYNIAFRYFLRKKDIEERYKNYPTVYPQYKDYLEVDKWDLREIR